MGLMNTRPLFGSAFANYPISVSNGVTDVEGLFSTGWPTVSGKAVIQVDKSVLRATQEYPESTGRLQRE